MLRAFLLPVCALAGGSGALAQSAPPAQALPEVSVIATTPLPGWRIDADKVPGNVQSLLAADLAAEGTASLGNALGTRLASVTLEDTLGDPFQPDLFYRGFEASPVLGAAQGLAVYQNGVRINEAFGDTVNWDLIPDIAIERIDLLSASPLYGLNALGGALALAMKNGFSYRGADAAFSGGSFERRDGTAQAGMNNGVLGVYGAAQVLKQDGWRLFAHDSLHRYYLDLSLRLPGAAIDVSYARAEDELYGPGAAPVQSLALDSEAVFTGPQNNLNHLDFVTLNASLDLPRSLALQGVGYFRNFRQSVANGDSTGYTACSAPAQAGLLCQPDGLTVLMGSNGAPLPDLSQGGTRYIGVLDSEYVHSQSAGGSLQLTASSPLLGRSNEFAAGASFDGAHIDFSSASQVGLIAPSLWVQPSGLVVVTPENTGYAATPVQLEATSKDYGLYATDSFDASAKITVTASARYNIAQVDLSDQLGPNLSGGNRFTHFNPALGATYQANPALTLYAGYSVNNRTPNASEIECSNPLEPCLLPSSLAGDPPNLRQVVAHSLEFGLRGRMQGTAAALDWNASAFRTTLNDDIYAVASTSNSGYFENIGSTRREGVEASLNYRGGRWSAHAQYSYIDATFRSPLTLSSPFNPFHDANGDITVRPGDELPGIPRQRLKAGADYALAGRFSVGASVVFVTGQYFHGDESNQNPQMPGYHLLNVHASYRLGERFEVFASVHNVLEERYPAYGLYSNPTGVGAPGIPPHALPDDPRVDNRFENPAAPRVIIVGATLSFY